MKSKSIVGVLVGLAFLILIVIVFSAGVAVGGRKVRHMAHWEEQYGRLFDDPGSRDHERRFPLPAPRMIPGGHGVFGKVLSVSGSTIVVQGKDNVEQTVLVTSSTMIRVGQTQATFTDIKPNADAAVLGAPNDQGQIEARLIRLMYAP